MSPSPGLRLLLTRSDEGNQRWAQQLTNLGYFPVLLPCIETKAANKQEAKQQLLQSQEHAQWLILTSRRGVYAVHDLMGQPPCSLKIATVGPATSAAVQELWAPPNFQSLGGTGKQLAEELLQYDPSLRRVLVAASAQAKRAMDEVFKQRHISVDRVSVYETVAKDLRPTGLVSVTVDYILLASPSAVQGLLNQMGPNIKTPVVCLGPTTYIAALNAHLNIAGQAKKRTLDSLLLTINTHFGESHG